ncbi:MAG: cbb3-type cytochrome c oxidase subunit II [Verrucomicrobiota bacterium]|nr:cbb3-type cytochrome c oxidase subunit II [Verrucomicrobiota bacterium]
MKNGFRIFLAALVALGFSWCAFVLAPVLQLGAEKQTTVLNSSDLYPVQRGDFAAQGLQVYRANGCAACHTAQVQQDGVGCDVVLTGMGTNQPADFKAFMKSLCELPDLQNCSDSLSKNLAAWNGALPKILLHGAREADAGKLADKLSAAGLKSEVRIVATGPDIARDWGLRHSVAEDFLWDDPVQLGSVRIGPDLANVGARFPDARWQLLHLYAPQVVVKGSTMPPFRYLFKMEKTRGEPAPDALKLPRELAPPSGYEVVPTDQARELAAYLLSLRAEVPLHDAPFTPPAPAPARPNKP